MKILFHVDEESRWKVCLGNIYNTLKYYENKEEDCFLEVVANAVAVRQLALSGAREASILDEMSCYISQGVRFVACRNALTGQKIQDQDLVQGVEVVDGGIIEIAQKQNEGWAYIRP